MVADGHDVKPVDGLLAGVVVDLAPQAHVEAALGLVPVRGRGQERRAFQPQPYAQLNFSYGNSVVTGNVILLSRTATDAQQFYNPPDQSGIADAYVNFRLPDVTRAITGVPYLPSSYSPMMP